MGSKDLTAWREWGHQLDTFDLNSISEEELNRRDIIGKLITGISTNIKFRRNFLRCAFRDAKLSKLEWPRVDYKDTVFIDTEIRNSTLGGGSTVSCTFSNCIFVRCSYEDAAIHDCFYQDCTFVDCDFRNSMIRNSRLTGCRFEHCATSNKLFDGCLLFSNQFPGTTLDFRAIIDNFGLDSQQLPRSSVREERSYPSDIKFSFEMQLSDPEWTKTLSPFETLKLQYYLAEGTLSGSETVDLVFEPKAWISLVRAPVNLMRLLQDFSEFIFYLYGMNRLPAIFILKLAILSDSIWRGFSDHAVYAQLGQVGSGIYFQCLQWLVDLDTAVAKWLAENDFKKIIFRSNDDADDQMIDELVRLLSPSLPGAKIQIRPRNSPVDLLFTHLTYPNVVFLLTLFFGTKVHIELSQQKKKSAKTRGKRNTKSLLTLNVGGAKDEMLHNALSLEGKLPGAMVLRLDVYYSSALVEKIKKVVRIVV